MISRILNNTTYKGIHEYCKENRTKKERIVREVPAIVSEELWNRTQALLRKNFVMASRNDRRLYLLRGLIRCGLCGRTYAGDGNNKKGLVLLSLYREPLFSGVRPNRSVAPYSGPSRTD